MEDKQGKLDLDAILKSVWKNLWMVVLALVIGVMCLYIAESKFFKPVYVSEATAVIRINSTAMSNASLAELHGSSAAAEITSQVFLQPVIREYAAENLSIPIFDGAISATVTPNTNILTLAVSAGSPKRAYELLGAVLEAYPRVSDTIFNNVLVEVMSGPELPDRPTAGLSVPKRLIIVVIPALLVLAIIALLTFLRETVKNESDFEQKIDAKLLGVIGHERQRRRLRDRLKGKKHALLVNSIYTGFGFYNNYQKIATKLDYRRRHNGVQCFLISSVLENEGKSTTAANIAMTLAGRDYKVLLLDMDFKKPALHEIFETELTTEMDLGDMLSGADKQQNFKIMHFKKTNLSLGLNKRPHQDFSEWIGSGFAQTVLKAFRKHFDFIIIDTPPLSVSADVTTMMKVADETILVVRTDWAYTFDINDCILKMKKLGIACAGCILNDAFGEFALFGKAGNDENGYYHKRYRGYTNYGEYGPYRDDPTDELNNLNTNTETEQQENG